MTTDLTDLSLEHYRLEELIGQGGMGSVYRAVDLNLARPVAVKVMHDELAALPGFEEQFQKEAQAAARLEHPSIIRIYHFGHDQNLLYIVMELVPGLSLGAYMRQLAQRKQVIRLEESLLLAAQVAEALSYAHRKGIIHRDIKPDNILVKELDRAERSNEPPLRAMVTDFGLAKLQDEFAPEDDYQMGTLDYMSPEQLQEQPLDGRSDLYSLGVVLYQLTTGNLPFEINTPEEALQKHVSEEPPVPHQTYPGLPISLGQVIWKAMEKRPQDRYQTGDEMARALREVATNLADENLNLVVNLDQSSVTSMVAAMDANPNLADTSRWLGAEQARPPQYDVLRVARNGEEPEWYGLQKRSFTIGRSEGNDIVLVGGNVSRWHARLEYMNNGWHIIDTDSTNGTFLDKTRLQPEKAYPWRWGQAVHMGPFDLFLQPGTGPAETVLPETDSQFSNGIYIDDYPERALPFAPPAEKIVADMRPRELKRVGICRVMLLNEGHARTPVTVTAGDPVGRLRVDTPTKQVTIDPDQKGVVDFYIEGRRPIIGRRKAYPFTMQVRSETQDWDVLVGSVKVRPIISIWLFFALLAFIGGIAASTYLFLNEQLPWSPQSLLDQLIIYLSGL